MGYFDRDHAATVEASTVPRRIAWGDDDQDVPHISLDRPQRADTPSDMRPPGSTLQSRAANPVSAPGQAAAVPPASVTSPVHSRHRDGPAGAGGSRSERPRAEIVEEIRTHDGRSGQQIRRASGKQVRLRGDRDRRSRTRHRL